jgi:chromosome segregation ATPase
MLSIVPGGGGGSNVANENFSMFASVTQPKNNGKSGKFNKSGRRLVQSAPSGQYADASKKEDEKNRIKYNNNASLDELDKMLEDDALALLNIKKDINQAQHDELEKIQTSVLSTKKEYDSYYVTNNSKEKQFQALVDQINSLVGVDKSTTITQKSAKSVMDELTEQTTTVLEELGAEQRTIKMQTVMIKRLDEEIGKCRIDIAKATVNLEHAKHDLSLAENNLQLNRQYLLEQESQFEKLQNTLKTRKDQRENKINMLQSISIEGEHSVTKLQQSLVDNTKVSLNICIIKSFHHLTIIPFCVVEVFCDWKSQKICSRCEGRYNERT